MQVPKIVNPPGVCPDAAGLPGSVPCGQERLAREAQTFRQLPLAPRLHLERALSAHPAPPEGLAADLPPEFLAGQRPPADAAAATLAQIESGAPIPPWVQLRMLAACSPLPVSPEAEESSTADAAAQPGHQPPAYLPFASARMGAAARVSTVQLRNALAKAGWAPGAIEPDAQGWPAFAVIGAMGEPLLVSVQVAK